MNYGEVSPFSRDGDDLALARSNRSFAQSESRRSGDHDQEAQTGHARDCGNGGRVGGSRARGLFVESQRPARVHVDHDAQPYGQGPRRDHDDRRSRGRGPNYIFPMMSGQYFLDSNFQLIYLLFRPLYWFGVGNTPELNEQLSVAYAPVYSNHDRKVTIKMKGYRWSNGETVDAQDVVFWMNMVKADAPSWAGYVPGPGRVPRRHHQRRGQQPKDTVTFTLDAPYSSWWFTYNELSQITPLPIAWDITSAPAAAGLRRLLERLVRFDNDLDLGQWAAPLSASAKACAKVYAFLTGTTEAGDLGTYASNPLWQIVDGPFRLTPYDASDGGATVVPNPDVLGPGQVLAQHARAGPVHDRRRRVPRAAGRQVPSTSATSRHRTCPSTRARPSSKDGPLIGAEQHRPRRQLQPRAGLPLGRQLLRPQLHQPGVRPDLQAALHPPSDAVADEPDALDPAVQRRLRRPDLRAGARLPADGHGHAAGELEPVPVQPDAREIAAELHGWKVVANGVTTCVKPGTVPTSAERGSPSGRR